MQSNFESFPKAKHFINTTKVVKSTALRNVNLRSDYSAKLFSYFNLIYSAIISRASLGIE